MKNREKRSNTGNTANRRLANRTVALLIICGVLAFVPLILKLWNLQVTRHDELAEMAVSQQTSTLSVSSERGTIYDCNGNVLAISSTAYDIILSPKAIAEKQAEYDEAKQKAIEEGKAYGEYEVDVEDLVVSGVAAILELDESDLHSKCADTDSQYKRVAIKADAAVAEEITAYIEEHDLAGCIYMQNNTKRYYPYSNLASQVIGFTNDSGGAYGLEAKFDSYLTGTDGLTITAQSGGGTDLLNFFQDYYEAEDGADLHLTLDTTIQELCQNYLEGGIKKYDVRNGGFIIVMDCNSGAILGMASSPTYDLNDYTTVTDQTLLNQIAQDTADAVAAGEDEDEAYAEAYSEAVLTQWRNKAINDTYEPGSTFKTLILAAALEEGVTDEDDSFYCEGSVDVADYTIRCSNRSGHGAQTLATAVGNSCNPAFITLGQRIGTTKFYKYMEAFGIVGEGTTSGSTGIELPGESASVVWDRASFNITNLATASFGQRLNITPIQLITAVNTVINGGYYYQPYVVDYIESASGDVTYSADTSPLRQVISEETSATCREILEGVVTNYTGKNAYRSGYRIGGKTGTSQTLDDGREIVSFVGFAPADDPQIIVLVAFDWPYKAGGDYTAGGYYVSGGNMAAPVAGDLIVDILDYLDYGTQYTADELTGADTAVPYLAGYDLASARELCEEYGFTCTVVGEGDESSIVMAQTAVGGSYIPEGSNLVLYIGDAQPASAVTVPDLYDMTPDEAYAALQSVGLYMKATGVSRYYTDGTFAYGQSTLAGETVTPGSVITVYFTDNSESTDSAEIVD